MEPSGKPTDDKNPGGGQLVGTARLFSEIDKLHALIESNTSKRFKMADAVATIATSSPQDATLAMKGLVAAASEFNKETITLVHGSVALRETAAMAGGSLPKELECCRTVRIDGPLPADRYDPHCLTCTSVERSGQRCTEYTCVGRSSPKAVCAYVQKISVGVMSTDKSKQVCYAKHRVQGARLAADAVLAGHEAVAHAVYAVGLLPSKTPGVYYAVGDVSRATHCLGVPYVCFTPKPADDADHNDKLRGLAHGALDLDSFCKDVFCYFNDRHVVSEMSIANFMGLKQLHDTVKLHGEADMYLLTFFDRVVESIRPCQVSTAANPSVQLALDCGPDAALYEFKGVRPLQVKDRTPLPPGDLTLITAAPAKGVYALKQGDFFKFLDKAGFFGKPDILCACLAYGINGLQGTYLPCLRSSAKSFVALTSGEAKEIVTAGTILKQVEAAKEAGRAVGNITSYVCAAVAYSSHLNKPYIISSEVRFCSVISVDYDDVTADRFNVFCQMLGQSDARQVFDTLSIDTMAQFVPKLKGTLYNLPSFVAFVVHTTFLSNCGGDYPVFMHELARHVREMCRIGDNTVSGVDANLLMDSMVPSVQYTLLWVACVVVRTLDMFYGVQRGLPPDWTNSEEDRRTPWRQLAGKHIQASQCEARLKSAEHPELSFGPKHALYILGLIGYRSCPEADAVGDEEIVAECAKLDDAALAGYALSYLDDIAAKTDAKRRQLGIVAKFSAHDALAYEAAEMQCLDGEIPRSFGVPFW